MYAKCATAQIDTALQGRRMDFKEYLFLVKEHNLAYSAEKFNIGISEADIQTAGIFPDPSLSFDREENYEKRLKTGYGDTYELGAVIELGGKRSARIDLAKSQKELSEMMLDDFFRELRAEAAQTYLESLVKKHLFQIKLDSYRSMKKLAEAIKTRYVLGSSMQIDEIQSQLESGVFFNDLLQAEAELKNSSRMLFLMTGLSASDSLFIPQEDLHKIERGFDINTLVRTAQENRTDVLCAQQLKQVAEKGRHLAEKEKMIDLEVRLGYGGDHSVPASQPVGRNFSAGLTIPLKISSFNNGNVRKAQLEKLQAEENIKKVKLQIEIEVRQAYQLYDASLKQVDSFENGLLEKGKAVLAGKMYSYERGETSLLEVLNAQRTFNEIQIAYYESLGKSASALIELEKASGIWDIAFGE